MPRSCRLSRCQTEGKPIMAKAAPKIREEGNKGKYKRQYKRYVVDYGRDQDGKHVDLPTGISVMLLRRSNF